MTESQPLLDWNTPSPYQRATAASITGVGAQGLVEEYTIDTPENVAFRYEIAGIGSRSIGGIVDTFIIGVLLILLLLATYWIAENVTKLVDGSGARIWVENLIFAIYFLLDFAIFWGYYVLFELFWNGQTPGKRLAKTRVVRSDGMPAGFAETAVRNLVRIVDFLPTAYALGLLTMFFNDSTRRLGDFAAGTLVIHDQGEVTLDSLLADEGTPVQKSRRPRGQVKPDIPQAIATPVVATPVSAPVVARPQRQASIQDEDTTGPFGANLAALTREEVELVRDALKREWRGHLEDGMLQRLARFVSAKTGAPLPPSDRSSIRRFLTKIADAWELAQ